MFIILACRHSWPFLAFPPLGWLGRDMQLRELGKWIVQLGSGGRLKCAHYINHYIWHFSCYLYFESMWRTSDFCFFVLFEGEEDFFPLKDLCHFYFVILRNTVEQECFSTQFENFVLKIRVRKSESKSKPTAQRHWETNKHSLFMKCGGVKNRLSSFKWSLLKTVLQMLPWSFQNICWPSQQMGDW